MLNIHSGLRFVWGLNFGAFYINPMPMQGRDQLVLRESVAVVGVAERMVTRRRFVIFVWGKEWGMGILAKNPGKNVNWRANVYNMLFCLTSITIHY